MKHILTLFPGIFWMVIHADAQRLEKLWETDTVMKVPESVLPDIGRKRLLVSNIDGASNAKDGKGHISIVSMEGKVTGVAWSEGLNAPKGMGIFGTSLYVADLDGIAVIDLGKGRLQKRINIPGSKFLNDLTIDDNGTVYVSDSETGIIHKIAKNTEPATIISGRKRPNGVLWHQGKLWFLDAGALFVFDGKNITQIASGMERSTDGIEPVDDERFLVSAWIGTLYLVNKNGSVKELLNTKEEKVNCADIGYDHKSSTVYVPTFNANKVVAYRLIME